MDFTENVLIKYFCAGPALVPGTVWTHHYGRKQILLLASLQGGQEARKQGHLPGQGQTGIQGPGSRGPLTQQEFT